MMYFDSLMKILLEQIKTNDKCHMKNAGFVDSVLVKICDEPVIGGKFMMEMTGDLITNTTTTKLEKLFWMG